jgi:hypothetical protein
MKALYLVSSALFVWAAPVLAQVVVASPYPSARLVAPFWLSATAQPCSGQAIASMGYSLDNSTNTSIVNGSAVNTSVYGNVGAHVLHVKSWGVSGASCVTNVPITIVPSPLTWVPSYATVSKEIQSWTGWHAAYDAGSGGGSSTGAMSVSSALSLSGSARRFFTTYSNYGGERYYIHFANDSAPKNFLYDTWVYIASPSGGIANLEMDMNEVIWNGNTVIYGVQCDGYSNTWDYTANAGTPQNYNDTWVHSNAWCNPRAWATNMWHHVQIAYSRDSTGNVTYEAIWFDGVEQDIYRTVFSAFALEWGNALLTNFQIDGLGSYGSATVYADHMNVYRW